MIIWIWASFKIPPCCKVLIFGLENHRINEEGFYTINTQVLRYLFPIVNWVKVWVHTKHSLPHHNITYAVHISVSLVPDSLTTSSTQCLWSFGHQYFTKYSLGLLDLCAKLNILKNFWNSQTLVYCPLSSFLPSLNKTQRHTKPKASFIICILESNCWLL